MARRLGLALLVLIVTAPQARAQWVVIDPANLVQTILIATRTEAHYAQLVQQFLTIQRMAQGLSGLSRYTIPAIDVTTIQPSRWEYGRTWLQGLATGDTTGTRYLASVLPLEAPDTQLSRLPWAARQAYERRLATVEVTDSVAMLGGHQVSLTRSYHDLLQGIVQELQRDVLSSITGYHDMTAILDKVAAGELVARRQDMAGNQLLSHVLEQMLARSKRQRDTEASLLNMQVVNWRDSHAVNEAFVVGTGDALRTWRQR